METIQEKNELLLLSSRDEEEAAKVEFHKNLQTGLKIEN